MPSPVLFGLKRAPEGYSRLSTKQLHDLTGHNTGNAVFHHAIQLQIGPGVPVVEWHDGLHHVPLDDSLYVIPCANILGPHCDLGGLAKVCRKIGRPFAAIGIGSQSGINSELPSVPEGTIDFLRAIAESSFSEAPNISVRGQTTHALVSTLGLEDRCVILGCPSLFINPEKDLGRIIKTNVSRPNRICILAGHHRWTSLSSVEQQLTQLIQPGDTYVCQSPLEMMHAARGEYHRIDEHVQEEISKYSLGHSDRDKAAAWFTAHSTIFFDADAWAEEVRKYDFAIGMRIHGIMVALQNGIPALCIVHDSRTHELCEVMKIPYILASKLPKVSSKDDLLDLFQFDADEFDSNRSMLADRYLGYLRSNGLQISKHLEEFT